MIKNIDHINISVKDLEKSKDFYIDLLWFKLEKEWILEWEWIDKVVCLKWVKAKYVQLKLNNSKTNLELIQYFSPVWKNTSDNFIANTIWIRHMAFQVEWIEKIYKKLVDN